MARQPLVARRAEELLGSSVVATSPVAGGDIATATRLRLSTGQTALMKTLPHAPEGFFEAEAAGLRWLSEVDGGVPLPEVLAAASDCVILAWVEQSSKTPVEAAAAFGQQLATTHAAGADGWGLDHDGYIGRLPLPNRTAGSWPEFYAVRRVLPYLKLARDRGGDHRRATPPPSRRSSAGSPSWCPTSRRPACTATSGTATASGARTSPSTSSTRRPTAATARSTWRCCTCSGSRTCRG